MYAHEGQFYGYRFLGEISFFFHLKPKSKGLLFSLQFPSAGHVGFCLPDA